MSNRLMTQSCLCLLLPKASFALVFIELVCGPGEIEITLGGVLCGSPMQVGQLLWCLDAAAVP